MKEIKKPAWWALAALMHGIASGALLKQSLENSNLLIPALTCYIIAWVSTFCATRD